VALWLQYSITYNYDFARHQNFIQVVRFLFSNFHCPIVQRINIKKNMAAIVQVTWNDIISFIDNLLMETEIL